MNRKQIIEQILNEIGAPTRQVTVAELSLILKKIDGSQATNVVIYGQTSVKMNKGGRKNEKGEYPNTICEEKVTKISRYNGMINFNYTNAVNNQLVREGVEPDFEAQGNWHTKKYDDFNGCVSMHVSGKGEYLSFKQGEVTKYGYLINDNAPTVKEVAMIETYKVPYVAPKNQGTEVPIDFRTMMLTNILFLKLKGEIYQVISAE